MSRQVLRAMARKNDYWTPDKWGHTYPGGRSRPCHRAHAAGRERVSVNVIAASASRERLSTRPASPYAAGSKHAWQRKAAKFAALRKLLGQDQ